MSTEDFGLEDPSPAKFNLEEFLNRYKLVLSIFLGGLILIGIGIFYWKNGNSFSSSKVEILENANQLPNTKTKLVVEIAGAVEKPGVYTFDQGARVDEVLIASGGLTAQANREWFEKTINRAAKLIDGQKIYIPKIDEQTNVLSASSGGGDQTVSSGDTAENQNLVNINEASTSDLDKLPGIGPVYAQSIIDHRPYSTVEELLTKGALKKNVYEKVKDKVVTY